MLTTFIHKFCSHLQCKMLIQTLVHRTCSQLTKLLFTTFVDKFAHVFHSFCSQILFTSSLQNFCLQLWFTTFIHKFFTTITQHSRSQVMFTSFFTTFVHNYYQNSCFHLFSLLFSQRIFTTLFQNFFHNLFSQLIHIALIHNFCSQF